MVYFYLFLKSLAMPPGLFILSGISSLLCYRRWPRFALSLLWVSIIALYAISTLYVGKHLTAWLEPDHAVTREEIEDFQPQAIVVLGADRNNDSPEYAGADTAGGHLLIRLRYGAHLHRQTSLPILVSGGPGYYDRTPQAWFMAEILEQEFQVPVSWREGKSLTTWENAAYSRAILQRAGIRRILLVTQAFHMPRSLEIFSQFGFTNLAAPTGFLGQSSQTNITDFYPGSAGFLLSCLALHEMAGLIYYRVKGLIVDVRN